MAYTVQQLANMAGVSVRTLHHYHDIGLLEPSYIGDNGYRYYEEPELVRLQQILFFRELDFGLDEITSIMQSPEYRAEDALEDQRELLHAQKQRIEGMIHTIDNTLKTMNDEERVDARMFEGLSSEEIARRKQEIKDKYDPQVVADSRARVASWSDEKMDAVKKEGEDIVQTIANLQAEGKTPDSPEVQEQIKAYHTHMNQFYDCTIDIFRGLGKMYVEDARFTEYYEKVAEGLAQFVHEGIEAYWAANQ